MKMEVYSFALCSTVMMHNTFTINKSDKHHLCLKTELGMLSWVVVVMIFSIVMIAA
jgi:hypothetical protein